MADERRNEAVDTPAGGEGDQGQQLEQTPAPVHTEHVTPAPTPTPAPAESYTKDAVEAMIQKARADEKSKMYGKLEEMKTSRDSALAEVKKLQSSVKSIQKELDDVREGSTSEVASIQREVVQLREENKKLEQTVNAVADAAIERQRTAELTAYREKAIAQNNVRLTELVVGDTEDEIDAAVQRAIKRESELTEGLVPKGAELVEERTRDLPRPLTPKGDAGLNSTPALNASTRRAHASLSPEEWAKRRQTLLREAEQHTRR